MSKFRLQSALDYRGILEDRARQSLGEAMKAHLDSKEELEREKESELALLRDFAERQKHGMAPDELGLYRAYIERKAQVLADCHKKVLEAAEVVERRREELCLASQEKKVLEKLKEKKLAEYELELRRKEAGFMDEIAVQKFKR